MRELNIAATTLNTHSLNNLLTEYYKNEDHDGENNNSGMTITEIDSFDYSWPINSDLDDCQTHKLVIINNQYLCHIILQDFDYHLQDDWVKSHISIEEYNSLYLDIVGVDELSNADSRDTALKFYTKRFKCLQSDPYQEFCDKAA